ncbi:MAG: HAD-IB family hydrolase [Patescibacteria group bacterium]|nr:HAD-IB family hydrolase [Patescibacteria group bacterium]
MQNAALFDLDGTLIPGKSTENLFIDFLMKKGEFHFIDMFRTFAVMLKHIGSRDKMFFQNKAYLKGKSVERLINLAEECFITRRNIIQLHKKSGDLLILISGSLYFIVNVFAQSLTFDDRRGTNLEVKDGRCTGRIDGIHPRGQTKIIILNEFVKKYNLDLSNSYGYGNSFLDRLWMERVGNPVAVNPDKYLLNYAKRKKWNIIKATADEC